MLKIKKYCNRNEEGFDRFIRLGMAKERSLSIEIRQLKLPKLKSKEKKRLQQKNRLSKDCGGIPESRVKTRVLIQSPLSKTFQHFCPNVHLWFIYMQWYLCWETPTMHFGNRME